MAYEHSASCLAAEIAPTGSVAAALGYSPVHSPAVTLFSEDVPQGEDRGKATAVLHAVDWLLRFQTAGVGSTRPAGLNTFSHDFYIQWIEPFVAAASIWGRTFDLPALQDERLVTEQLMRDADLLAVDQLTTLVHGDFYTNNTLWGPSGLVVIDWELASWASGPIDLAAITLGWDTPSREKCDSHYVATTSARLGLSPDHVRISIAAARRHVIARVVGGLPAPSPEETRRIRRLGKRLTSFAELLTTSTA